MKRSHQFITAFIATVAISFLAYQTAGNSATFFHLNRLWGSSERVNPEIGAEQKIAANSYARRPAVLRDMARPGTSFFEFREALRRAVSERHVEYLRAISAEDIKLSFGLPLTLEELNIENPNALFWKHLERTINTGCAPFEGEPEIVATPNSEVWICPHVYQAVQVSDPFQDVFIVGKDVNVREQPRINSRMIDVLSNEVVKFDNERGADISDEDFAAMQTVNGWIPVVTPNGKRGYVSSRYAYTPAGYRTYFVNDGEGWKMTVFVSGD